MRDKKCYAFHRGDLVMASVSYLKLHSPQDVKRILRHCDMDYRLKDNHANLDIDKSKTIENGQSFDFPTACSRYDDRIKELDSVEGANKRKDRVTAFSLEIPIPLGISDEESYAEDICELVENAVGSENVVCEYLHLDEIHDYVDSKTKEDRTSLAHLHIIVVPEVDGKLNGKEFSSRKNMKAMNAAIDKMTREKYNVPFLTGDFDKSKSEKSVEELKNDSRIAEMQRDLEKEYKSRASELENEYAQKRREIEEREEAVNKKVEKVKEKWNECKEFAIKHNKHVDKLKEKEAALADKEKELAERKNDLDLRELHIEDEIRKRANEMINRKKTEENEFLSKNSHRELPFPY